MLGIHFAAVLLAAVSTAYAGKGRWEPYPVCEQCRSPAQMTAPGIGFDLTPSYGTAAIRFDNGSTVDVAQVPAGDSYITLMQHYTLRSSYPRQPTTPWERMKYGLERAKRRLNKQRGLPATEDVGTIAEVLQQLYLRTNEVLGEKITVAVIVWPNLPGLTNEDVEDAMEYVGLRLLTSYNSGRHIFESSAAYGASGHGLCSKPEDIEACEDENIDIQTRYIFTVSFSKALLSLMYSHIQVAYQGYEYLTAYEYDLGLESMDDYPDPATYWAKVTHIIREFVKLIGYADYLQVLGESATNEDFVDALQDALRGTDLTNTTLLTSSKDLDPLTLSSRGAAEFAKRFQIMTWDCKEPKICRAGDETWADPVLEL